MLCAAVGCDDQQSPSATSKPPAAVASRPSVALRVLVVNEPELAAAVEQLAGEWAERFGGELAAVLQPGADVVADHSLDADVVIFPSRYLGELCSRRLIRPVRNNVLEDPTFNADDVLLLVRRKLIHWGGETMALPLGVDSSITASIASESSDVRPALRLLIEAAPAVASAERDGDLFDPQSMRPRVAEPEFVDALARLATAGTPDLQSRPATAPRVPVLGIGDRLAAVTTASRNAATAFQLLGWLAGPEISSQLARAGSATLPVRRSLASSPAWYDASTSAGRRNELGHMLEQSLGGERCLVVPRIPGLEKYLAALDTAVERVLSSELQSPAALDAAAAQWEAITDAIGRESQREAYLKHLDITSP
jgi:hypothetical protein